MVGFDPKKVSSLSQKEIAFAGAASGFFTRLLAQPLDVLKIRLQLQVEPISYEYSSKYKSLFQTCHCIFKEEGISAFWKGHVCAQILSVLYGFIQFSVFEYTTARAWHMLPSSFSVEYKFTRDFLCGTISGSVATVVSLPVDLIRTRFIAQGNVKIYHSIRHAFTHVLKNEGFFGFYKGFWPTLLQTAPYTGLQFCFYNFSQSFLHRLQFIHDNNMLSESLICGGIAGFGSKICIYPLDLIKKRLQIQGFEHARVQFGSSQNCKGMLHCLKLIVQNEGFTGFYKGLSPSLIKAVAVSALHFSSYELICQYLKTRNL